MNRTLCHAIFGLLLTLSANATAQTSGFVGFENRTVQSDPFIPTAFGGLSHQLNPEVGISAFFLITEGWAEVHIGPTWTPIEELTLGLGVGLQQSGDTVDLQISPSVVVNVGPVNFTGILELNHKTFTNPDTIWYDLSLSVSLIEELTFGIKDRRTAGVGPFVTFNVPIPGDDVSVSLSIAWLPLAAEEALFTPESTLAWATIGF